MFGELVKSRPVSSVSKRELEVGVSSASASMTVVVER